MQKVFSFNLNKIKIIEKLNLQVIFWWGRDQKCNI